MRLASASLLGLSAVLLAGASGGRTGRVVRVERTLASIVDVPGGSFEMGLSDEDADAAYGVCSFLHGDGAAVGLCEVYREMLRHMLAREIRVDGFRIDRTEVTVGAYRACVADRGCAIDPLIVGDERLLASDDLPQVNVTWDEAQAFCATRGGTLPTEAQWERAARGDDGRRWPWGDQDRVDDFNHGQLPPDVMVQLRNADGRNELRFHQYGDPDDSDGHAFAAPVGSYVWDEGPYGTHDQAGNVAEWTLDEVVLEGYDDLPSSNPQRRGAFGGAVPRAIRGGSWRDPPAFARTAARVPMNLGVPTTPLHIAGDQRQPHIGFRCAYPPQPR